MDSKELFGEVPVQEEPIMQEMPVQEEPVMQEIPTIEQETVSASYAYEEKVEFRSEHIQQQVESDSKKGNNGIAVAIVTLLFILVIGLCVYIAVSVSNMIPQKGQEDKEYKSQTGNPWEELLGDDYIGDSQDSNIASQDYPNYNKESFKGPYYENVVDCIDENVPYKIKREFQNVSDEENYVDIHTSYIQLDGDIPGVEEINRLLKKEAVYFVEIYEENKEELHKTLEETGAGISAEIKSYVTYNTESIISVVIWQNVSVGYMYSDVALRSFNINLDTGMILDNTSILDLNDFGAQFRERSNAQNGISETGIESFTDKEIEAMLNDEESLIIFYTPLGMEIGYNYKNNGGIGWITITMQDYEEYILRM